MGFMANYAGFRCGVDYGLFIMQFIMVFMQWVFRCGVDHGLVDYAKYYGIYRILW